VVARTSSRQITAREQARERAATYAARERELVQLAETFFLADGEAEDVLVAAETRIAAIREQAERDVAATRAKAAAVAEQMLATGTPIAQVADRLGMSMAELRRVRAAAGTGASDGADAADNTDVDAVGGDLDAAPPAVATPVEMDVEAPGTETVAQPMVRRNAA